MTIFVDIVLLGWIPMILLLFGMLPARRAVIVAFIGAWLFLPMAGYSIAGLPDFGKMTATSYGVLLGVLIFDAARLTRFRPSWIDIPIVVYCAVPMASSLSNGLGAYDGASAIFGSTVSWGIPYFIGRLYFSDLEGLRELAVGIFVGGLIYVPLCLYEIRMSPQLHDMIYGFHQHRFGQTKRFGGWRPMVFMQHGLAVGMWMAAASLVGVWLWHTKALTQIRQVPMMLLLPILVATTIMCKSFGAIVLLIGGLGALYSAKLGRTVLPCFCLAAIPVAYMGLRSTDTWSGQQLVDAVAVIDRERSGSLQFRLEAEDLLVDRAWQRAVFGWGTWSRNRVRDERGRDLAVTDGLWVITFGQRGLIGLVALTAIVLLPAVLVFRGFPARTWNSAAVAPAVALSVILVLYMIDNLFNAMVNPVFVLVAGGLAGLVQLRQSASVAAAASRSRWRTSPESVRQCRVQLSGMSGFGTNTSHSKLLARREE